MVNLKRKSNGLSVPRIRQDDRRFRAFIDHPVIRVLLSALLTWIAAVVLAILIWPLYPDESVYNYDGGLRPVPLAERVGELQNALKFIPLIAACTFLVLGPPAGLVLWLIAKRIGLLWRGWLMAAICACLGMAVGYLVTGFCGLVEISADTEHHLALCDQWDSTRSVQWLDDPRCGSTYWYRALALIPGGSAGFVYWLVRYRWW